MKAPEVLCGVRANERSDMYAYGLIVWVSHDPSPSPLPATLQMHQKLTLCHFIPGIMDPKRKALCKLQ